MAAGDRPCPHRLEVAGRMDHIDAQDRETPLEGVAPAAARGGEGILEIAAELAVDDVVRRRVEVAAEDRGRVGEIRRLFEHLLDDGQLRAPQGAVDPVVPPCGAVPEADVGGGGLQVDVDDLDPDAVSGADGHLLVPLGGIAHFPLDFPAGDHAVGGAGAVVAVAAVERVGDVFHLMRKRVLDQDDVGFPRGDVGRGVAVVEDGAIHRHHTDHLAAVARHRTTGVRGRFPQVGEHPRLVGPDQQGDRPDGRHRQRQRCAEDVERRAAQKQAQAAPDPDGQDGERRETVRLAGETIDRQQMQQQRARHQHPSEPASQLRHDRGGRGSGSGCGMRNGSPDFTSPAVRGRR